MFKEDFVLIDEAIGMKKLGFDEICPTKYGMTSLMLYENWKPFKNSDDLYEGRVFCNDLCAAPTYAQCFRWFRKNHGYVKDIYYNGNQWEWCIHKIPELTQVEDETLSFYDKYEQAELACLRIMINLVKYKIR